MVSEPEVFIADEAAELFESYYTTGDIPSKYWLRPVDGYDEDGTYIPPLVDEPSRQVYRGDIPGDFYEGRWPNRLTIYAAIGPEGLTLKGHDSVEWPEKDQRWTIRVAPEQLPLLREVLGAAPDMDATDLLDLVATRFEDRTVPVRGVAWWLKEAGIEYHASQEFLEN
jgi:hypothetical protein